MRNVLLVTGGRDYECTAKVQAVLDDMHELCPFTHVVHGGARGLDIRAGNWARQRGVQEVRCDANWNINGKAAGVLRNTAMLDLCDPDTTTVVAFPGGRGTANMVRQARAAGFRIKFIS